MKTDYKYNLRPRYERLAATKLLVTVKESNITTTTGQVSVYTGSQIYEDKFAGGLDGVCLKVDSFGNTLEQSALTSGGTPIAVVNIDNNGNYQLSGQPVSASAIRYILITDIENLRHIPIDAREVLRFVESVPTSVNETINYAAYWTRNASNMYINVDGLSTNTHPLKLPFAAELYYLRILTRNNETWILEIQDNGIIIQTVSIVNATETILTPNWLFTGNEQLQFYVNGTRIRQPRVELYFVKQ